jgi:hypothetical protein
MWPFSKSEDEYYAQPQREESSFLGNIGSMLWTGVKAAFYALLAVVTLGTIFKVSDTARNFVDGFTGGDGKGDGKGLASRITGLMDKVTKPVTEFFTPSQKTDTPNITSVSAIKVEKIGDAEVLLPNAALTKSAINQNPAPFTVLTDINGARKSYNSAMVTTAEGKAANDALDQLRNQERAYLREVDAWNSAVANKTSSEQKVKGEPLPSVIPLNLPDVDKNPLLHNVGITKFSAVWNSATPLQKILYLEQEIGASSDPIKKPAGLLPADPSIHIPDRLRNAYDVNEITSLRFQSKVEGILPPKTSADNDPKDLLRKANAVASKLIADGRFDEASLVADTIISRLEIRGSQLTDNEKTRGQEYKSAIASLKETREYATTLELRRELDPILSETYAAGRIVAMVAPQKINEYEQQVSSYRETAKLAKALENGASNIEPDLKSTIPNGSSPNVAVSPTR